MTERKRPWWMLHWPSWAALVVFGGAFVVLNLVVYVKMEHEPGMYMSKLVAGWPIAHCHIEGAVQSDRQWLWSVEGTAPEYRWDLSSVAANVTIGFLLVLLAVSVVEYESRRARLSKKAEE